MENDRFWSKVDIRGPEECWNWIPGKSSKYGQFWYQGKNYGAHVFSAILSGKFVDGKIICHSCDNPRCVNPAHLFSGTYSDNTQDMLVKKRFQNASGSKSHLSKLSDEQVSRIKETYTKGKRGCGVRVLAKKHGVRPYAVWCIVNEVTRKDG